MNITFGRYRGQSIEEVFSTNPQYLIWAAKNFNPARKREIKLMEHIKSMVAPLMEQQESSKRAIGALRVDVLVPVVKALKALTFKKTLRTGYTSAWSMSIIASLESGDVLSARAREIVADMCGKAAGRRNSKKYIEARGEIDSAFEAALAISLNNRDE